MVLTVTDNQGATDSTNPTIDAGALSRTLPFADGFEDYASGNSLDGL